MSEVGNNSLGDRIKFILECENINGSDLARAINVKPSHISQVIHNKKNLSDRTIKLISTTYGININWLTSGIGEMYIDKDIYNQYLEKMLHIFNELDTDFQQEAIDYCEFLHKLQIKFNKSIEKIINQSYN